MLALRNHHLADFTLLLRAAQLRWIEDIFEIDRAELFSFEFRYRLEIVPLLPADSVPEAGAAHADPYLRERYRRIARLCHPDRAGSPQQEIAYGRQMAAATAALYSGDIVELERILEAFDCRLLTEQERVDSLEYRIYHFHVERARLRRSGMWQLMEKERELLAQGRNMLKEMADLLRMDS